jgi:hypothetical protein
MAVMQTISAQAVPNQQLQCQLGTQAVTLNIYQTNFALHMDVLVGAVAIIKGAICENLNRIIRDAYLGFAGDFVWFDTLGTANPVYTGIGTRYQLVYLSPTDLAAVGQTG